MLSIISQVLLNGALLGFLYALLSLGLSFCFGITRVANSSIAAFTILSSFFTYWLSYYGIDPLFCLPLNFVIFLILGMITYKVAIYRVIGTPVLVPFTVTYFLAFLLESIMVLLWRNDYRSVITSYSMVPIKIGEVAVPFSRIITMIVCSLCFFIFVFIIKFTYTGKCFRAVWQDREAAQLMGMNVNRLLLLSYGISTGLAGIAGTLFGLIFPFYPSLQGMWVGKLYAIVALGGMGSIEGSLIAGLIFGMVETTVATFAPAMWGTIVGWVVMLLVLLIKPTGLFGEKVR
jgi:branched-chain amino acid transport system permease protein